MNLNINATVDDDVDPAHCPTASFCHPLGTNRVCSATEVDHRCEPDVEVDVHGGVHVQVQVDVDVNAISEPGAL